MFHYDSGDKERFIEPIHPTRQLVAGETSYMGSDAEYYRTSKPGLKEDEANDAFRTFDYTNSEQPSDPEISEHRNFSTLETPLIDKTFVSPEYAAPPTIENSLMFENRSFGFILFLLLSIVSFVVLNIANGLLVYIATVNLEDADDETDSNDDLGKYLIKSTECTLLFFQVTGVIMGFSRLYQLFMTIVAWKTKRIFHFIYLMLYEAMLFAINTVFVILYPYVLKLSNQNEEGFQYDRETSVLVVVSISVSAGVFVAQVIIYAFLHKKVDWKRLQDTRDPFSAKKFILLANNYRGLVMINTFSIMFDLLSTVDFAFLITYKSLTPVSIVSIVLAVLTPFFLGFSYFGMSRAPKRAIVVGTVFGLVVFAFSVVNNLMFVTYSSSMSSPNSFLQEYNFVIAGYYYELFVLCRHVSSFFHYVFLLANFAVSVKLLSMIYGESDPASTGGSSFFDRIYYSSPQFSRLSQNALNSQSVAAKIEAGDESITECEKIVSNSLRSSTSSTMVHVLSGTGFNIYVFVNKATPLSGWYHCCALSCFWIAILSLWTPIIWRKEGHHILKAKYLLVLRLAISLVWLTAVLYEVFLVLNWCNYFDYKRLIYNYAEREANEMFYEISGTVTVGDFFKELTGQDTTISDHSKSVIQDYMNAKKNFLPHKTLSAVIIICASLVAFVTVVSQGLTYAKTQYYLRKIQKATKGTYLSLSQLQVNTLRLVTLQIFNIYMSAATFTLLMYFDYSYFSGTWLLSPLGIQLESINRTGLIVGTAFYVAVGGLISALVKKFPKVFGPFNVLLHILWLAYLAYEHYFAYYIYRKIYFSFDQINTFHFVFSCITLQWASSIMTIILASKVAFHAFRGDQNTMY